MIGVETPAGTVFLRHSDIRESFAQAAIADRDVRLFCLCRGTPGAPLFARRAERWVYVARAPNTAHLHEPGCPHGDPFNLASQFGAPSGAFSTVAGDMTVHLDRLFPMRSSGGVATGMGKARAPNANGLLALLWLLLVRAGLNVALPCEPDRGGFTELQSAAEGIRVAGAHRSASLGDMLLTPIGTRRGMSAPSLHPRDRLDLAHRRGTPILTACMVSPNAAPPSGTQDINLRASFGVSVWVPRTKFDAALRSCAVRTAREQSAPQHLLFCLAEVREARVTNVTAAGPAIYARALRCAGMPVTRQLLPLPSARVATAAANAMRTGEVFVVRALHDARLQTQAYS